MKPLNPVEQAILLDLSRQSLRLAVAAAIPESYLWQYMQEELLCGGDLFARPASLFVTLRKAGRLRGCIGSIGEPVPLGRATVENSAAAALRDPRFPAVEVPELIELGIEISLLGPFERLFSPDQLQIGRHGLLVSQGAARGLLLPQVATELNLDKTGFLDLCCKKAGLPENVWQTTAIVHRFSAQHFGHSS